MNKNIAKIAITKPLHNLFDYEIPENMGLLKPGCRVCIEFGKKEIHGFVMQITEKNSSFDYKLKKIIKIIDTKPLLDLETLNLLFIKISLKSSGSPIPEKIIYSFFRSSVSKFIGS